MSSRSNEARINCEREIAFAVVFAMLAAGYGVLVDNGGGEDDLETITAADSADEIHGKLRASDEDRVYAIDANKTAIGWVYLVYGNSGYDTVSDYTVNMEPLLATASAIADKYEKEWE